MSDKFLRNLLKSKGFSADISKQIEKAVENKAKQDTEQKEMADRELALAMTQNILNDVLPHLRKVMETPPTKKIIVDDK